MGCERGSLAACVACILIAITVSHRSVTISDRIIRFVLKSFDYSRYLTISEVTIKEQFYMAGIQKDSGPGKFVIIGDI